MPRAARPAARRTVVSIRDATYDDLAAIFAIYDEEVLRGTATFETVPRTAVERQEWFEAHARERYPVIVAEAAGKVLGWARLQPWSPRPAYLRTAEDSVYVAESARGRGIGRALLARLLRRARAAGIAVVLARIADGNPASIRLHEKAGFRTVGVMRRVGEKFGRILDVTLLDLQLDGVGGDLT
jgi:phosphinothricin acetyltransferase